MIFICMISISPGMIRTPIFAPLGVNDSNADAFFEQYKSDYLVGRIGEVSDTSSAIAYLASETFVNGILLPIDGGYICGSRCEFID